MPVQVVSAPYFLFVGLVFFLYWTGAGVRRLRLAIILLANYLFCARFGLFYVVLIPVCSTADYCIGIGLTRLRRPLVRRLLLGFSLAINLGLLLASRHIASFLKHGAGWDWIFPLGLSFYAFQALSYTIDLYRGDGEPAAGLLNYVSAASFFPTLQAGPIARMTEMVKQFAARPVLTRTEGGQAFFLIATGLLKKVLIADYLGESLVNRVFDTPNLYSGAEALIAVYAYSLQLYYDFSGYTDIARGVAQLLGIKLPINFDRPYSALNLAEFWRKWHISFSSWLRDYLYFALPGKRTKVMPYVNLVITMVLGGLWHGLTLPYAVWGLLHGTGLAVVRWWQVRRGRAKRQIGLARRAVAILCTYHFVCFTWVFFRAASLSDAWALLARIASLTPGFENVTVLLAALLIISAGLLFLQKSRYARAADVFARSPFYVHAVVLALVAIAIQLLAGRGSAPFVYSRF